MQRVDEGYSKLYSELGLWSILLGLGLVNTIRVRVRARVTVSIRVKVRVSAIRVTVRALARVSCRVIVLSDRGVGRVRGLGLQGS
eukprot:1318579-Amorphochlora_amoeboformis.AAC.1